MTARRTTPAPDTLGARVTAAQEAYHAALHSGTSTPEAERLRAEWQALVAELLDQATPKGAERADG